MSLADDPPTSFRTCFSALRAKLKQMRAERNAGSALRKGLSLLLRGDFGAFRRKLALSLEKEEDSRQYQAWIAARRFTDESRRNLRWIFEAMENPPLISIVMPVYNVPEKYLRLCLDSVQRQIYPRWELCIADDCSPAPHIRRVLGEYAGRDARIRIVYRRENGNIAAATNSALELARGPYMALLDNDDELAEHAILRAAQAIVADPALDMIYSDEDKIDTNGRRFDPFFKPDWSPEYFLACMYTCHLGVYRTQLVRDVGAFRSQFDTSQDYDMVLRLAARSSGARIHHIPDILYHWRTLPTSAASSTDAKPKAYEVARRAIQARLDACGIEGRVEAGPSPGFHRVRFALTQQPLVSVILADDGRASVPVGAAGSFRMDERKLREGSSYKNLEILVAHEAAAPGAESAAAGTAAKLNAAAARAKGAQIVFLHPALQPLAPDWIESLLEFSQQGEIGAVGARLVFPDGRIRHAGLVLSPAGAASAFAGFPGDHHGYFCSSVVHRNASAVGLECLMTRADVFRDAAGFDEELSPLAAAVDYCLKVGETGRRIVYTPFAQLCWQGPREATADGSLAPEWEELMQRWPWHFEQDAFYNPNLSREAADFKLHSGF